MNANPNQHTPPRPASKKPEKSGALHTTAKVTKTTSKVFVKIGTYALNVILTILLIGIVTGAIIAGAFAVYIKSYIDPSFDIDDLKLTSDLSTSLYYRSTDEGTGNDTWVEMEGDRLSGSENRIWVKGDAIPQDMKDAIIAIEDKRFMTHNGVDIRRTTGAIFGFISGNDSYGGSTITQQLIKQVTGEDDVTIQRKIQEMMRALDLETKRSKEEILEMYLNTIYLSQGSYGVQVAANTYFGKDISECTLVECAALAAIPQAPTKWDPVQNPDNNKERRDVIIREMYDQGMISPEERDAALAVVDLDLVKTADSAYVETIHSYYVDAVIDDVIDDLQEELGVTETIANQMVFSGGLKIYTAQDTQVQSILEECYRDDSIFPSVSSGVQPQSAMVIMDQNNGDIVALIGGRGQKTTSRGFNRATQAKRQPGSSIKPLSAYSLALDQGLISYASPIDDCPYQINPATGRMWPTNYPAGYVGLVPAYYALQVSKNTCAVQLVAKMTPRSVYDYLSQNYHLSTLVDGVSAADGSTLSDVDLAPLALGGMTYGVTVRDMTNAYCTFAASGIYHKGRTYLKVLDSEGNVILSNDATPTVLLKESTAQILTKMLQNVVSSGTAKNGIDLDDYLEVAGKTGTTNETKDLYFVGYTPYYTAATWCGFDQPKTIQFDQNASKRVWNTVMTRVHQSYIDAKNAGETLETFPMSSRIVTVTVCKDSGLLPGSYCSLDPRGDRLIKSYFDKDNVPTETCDCHVPVRFCIDSGCVAGPNCTNVKIIALVKYERKLAKQAYITDAQYTYADIPTDYVYPSDTAQPFYINTYPQGMYAGSSGSGRPVNSFCVEHNYALTDAVLPWSRPAAQEDGKATA